MQKAAAAAVVLLYFLHQDYWFWREARPLVFGFLPVGLFYHAAYTVVSAGVLALLVKAAWPSHLEDRLTGDAPGPERVLGSREEVPRAARGMGPPRTSGPERVLGPRDKE